MLALRNLAAGALALVATCGMAYAQMTPAEHLPEGRLYVFHSKASGGCPELDWHIVVGNNDSLTGMISWDNMQHMAKATGAMTSNRHFKMTAKEVGGENREAEITGTVNSAGWIIANIDGPGVKCERVTIPFYVATPGGGSG